MNDEPRTITLSEYQKLCEEAAAEESTWRRETYLGEDLVITPNGECLWEMSNWWLPSEEAAKFEIRQNAFKIQISILVTERDLLSIRIEKKNDGFFGMTQEYLEKRIPQIISVLQEVFGLTLEEIEAACVQEIRKREAYKMRDEWFKADPQGLAKKGAEGYRRRLEIEEEHKDELSDPILPEKNHQYCVEYLKKRAEK